MRQAPSARATWPRWTGLASASRTTGAEWKRIPTGKPSARCWNVASAVIIDGAYRVATPAVKRPCVMKYCWNSSGSTPSPLGVAGLRRVGAEHLGELAVEIDQLLGDRLPFLGVGVQEFRLGPPPEDGTQLPPEVPGVVHRHVHALAGLGAVRVAGVAGDEHPRQAGGHLRRRHVVELVAQTLADLVHRPPPDVFDLDGVRVQDPVRDLGQLLRGDAPVVEHAPCR